MSNKVFEDAPQQATTQKPTVAVDKFRKQARQLAYDIRYKVKSKFKEGQKTDPVSLKRSYIQELGKSSAPGPVKLLAKKMLIGEQYDYVDVIKMVESSTSFAYSKVFENIEEEKTKKTYVLRVKDPKAGTIYYRSYNNYSAAESKKLQLEKKGLKVEFTSKESETYDGKANKDYDGDGKVESGSKEHAGSVHNAIQRKKGGVADGKDTRKEEFIYEKGDGEKIDILPKGKKGCEVKINPKLGEHVKYSSQYFYEMGLNENGVEILIEKLGLENFVEYVSDITEQSIITEERAAKRYKYKPGETKETRIAAAKAAIEKKEKAASAKKASRAKSVTAAKSEQKPTPKATPKKSRLDGIARAVLKGIDRHNTAMSKAKRDIETTKNVAKNVGKGAKKFGQGFASGVKTVGNAAKVVKKVATNEAVGQVCENCGGDHKTETCESKKVGADKKVDTPDPRAVPTMVNLVKNKMRARGLKMSFEPEGKVIESYNDPGDERKFAQLGAKRMNAVAKVSDKLDAHIAKRLKEIRDKDKNKK